MVEIVKTKGRREAFCAVCSHSWKFDVMICHCNVVPIPHEHAAIYPICPRCGKTAQMTRPA
jgi:hypothetical protein